MKPKSKFLLSCLPLLAVCYALAEKSSPVETGSSQSAGAAATTATATTAAVAVASSEMAAAALDFLGSLDAEQKAQAQFSLTSEERENWRFVPIERKGLPLKVMRPDQRHLAMALLSTTLSNEGLRKVTQIMSLEKILFDLENSSPKRDPEKYFVSIFGTPSATGDWGWRYEGHHMSMNITLAKGKVVSLTPTFLGANPGVVKDGPRQGLEVLQEEDTKGIALFKSLTVEQQKSATIATEVPKDIFTAENRVAEKLQPAGLAVAGMDAKQKDALYSVVEEYVRRYRPELADADIAAIKAAAGDQVHFAWIGAAEVGQAHYYRVQGPTFLFEYDNMQNDARHPHAVWREFAGDFGRDMLAEHYKAAH